VTPVVCVGAVVVEDGRLLLISRGRAPGAGLWSVPGGRVEAGETLAGAVVRELAEETGVAGFCEDLVGIAERIDDEHHFVILDFRVSVLEASAPTAGDDAVEAEWVPLDAVRDRQLVEGLEQFLEDHGIIEPIRPFRI
jgi:8-oxo-dGTP diphosphatase